MMRPRIATLGYRVGLYLGVSILSLAAGISSRATDIIFTLDDNGGLLVQDNSATVELLRVHEADGHLSVRGFLWAHGAPLLSGSTFIGTNAGNLANTGYSNTAFGQAALTALTSGNRNTAVGTDALAANTNGFGNTAVGERSLFANVGGQRNSAFGSRALRSNTSGFGNSAFGEFALYTNLTGIRNSAFGLDALFANTGNYNSAFGNLALNLNGSASNNSAFGQEALRLNVSGAANAAFGRAALRSNLSSENSAFGAFALRNNTSGANNAAFGGYASYSNQIGNFNSAFGDQALISSTGSSNTAVGHGALGGALTGGSNIAVGVFAGLNQTSGSNNIYIGNSGAAAESGQIKIGSPGTHTQTTIAGIASNAISGSTVLVNGSGVLGVAVSSRRFKRDVQDMGEASDVLAKLHPVTFRYREEVAGGDDSQQYGLIAEEVAQVAPDLVATGADGRPFSVHYHLLAPMLLNEVQEQQRTIEAQQGTIAELLAQDAKRQRAIDTLAEHVQGLEKRLAARGSAQ
jgi:hypothetical protein